MKQEKTHEMFKRAKLVEAIDASRRFIGIAEKAVAEYNGPRFGECYTQEKATIVSRQRFDELKDKRIIPEKAEFVCVE